MSEKGGEGGSGNPATVGGGGYVGGLPFPILEPIYTMLTKDYVTDAKFPELAWRPDLYALLAVAEFARSDWSTRIDPGKPTPLTDEEFKTKDIAILSAYKKERSERYAEILDQDVRLHVWFAHALMLSSQAHPHAIRVIEMALQVGALVAVHFKNRFNRARPQQVCPAILPIIPGPMHPSYPSGHSLQSHLIAAALSRVAPAFAGALEALAHRIGRNREIAGVHYTNDTEAGKNIADQAFLILEDKKICPTFVATLDAAIAERERDRLVS